MLTVTVEEVQGAAGAPSLTLGVGKGLLDLEVVWELAEHTESEDAKGRERRVFQAERYQPLHRPDGADGEREYGVGSDDDAEGENKVQVINGLVHHVKLCSCDSFVRRRAA